MAGEGGVPVWGIEVGGRIIRAVRAVRRPEGGVTLLDYREGEATAPGAEGALAFLRKHHLRGHPLVLAIESPSTHLRTVALSPAESAGDDVRGSLLEYVHPEPELVEIHSAPLGDRRHLLCAEDRARVESFLIALERADLPAYALLPGLAAVYECVHTSGLFPGDGIVIRVHSEWSDVLFLDGEQVRRLGLPVGAAALEGEETRQAFAQDLRRLIDYHRTRTPIEGEERIALLGVPASVASALGPLLPAPPVAFPADAAPLRGKGRISLLRALELARLAPAAVGAAMAGASAPPHLALAFHDFPDRLPGPPRAGGTWIAAALLLWAAAGTVYFGVGRETDRLRAADRAPGPAPTRVSTETAEAVRDLEQAGRRRLAYPEVIDALLRSLPDEPAAPWRVTSLGLDSRGSGFRGEITLRLPGAAAADESDRVKAARKRARAATGAEPAVREDGEDLLITVRIPGEKDR
jgi:hypothetical protein